MKKVLIALDYGLSAHKIAQQGYELAKSMNAEITLLHVIADQAYYTAVDSGPFMGFYGSNFFDLENNFDLKESSLNFLQKIKSMLNDDEIETIAEQGDFPTVIIETAKRIHADMIVLGSHSKNWLEKAVMGSVTESVLKQTRIPMFIIPVKEHS